MKKEIKLVKKRYSNEILIAKANGFDGVMIPLDCDYDLYCLSNMDDIEYIHSMAYESGWNIFVTVDFYNDEYKIINLYEDFAA